MFDTIVSCIEYIRSGKLRAAAVTTATRSEALPDIPVLGDTVASRYGDSIVRCM